LSCSRFITSDLRFDKRGKGW